MEAGGEVWKYSHFMNSTYSMFPNSIADQLLDEQLGLVAAELADVCDKCVDGLYTAEFTVPMTTRT